MYICICSESTLNFIDFNGHAMFSSSDFCVFSLFLFMYLFQNLASCQWMIVFYVFWNIWPWRKKTGHCTIIGTEKTSCDIFTRVKRVKIRAILSVWPPRGQTESAGTLINRSVYWEINWHDNADLWDHYFIEIIWFAYRKTHPVNIGLLI